MTKWARVRRRKKEKKAEDAEHQKDEELQPAEPQIEDLGTQQEKITENVQQGEKTSLKGFSMFKKPTQQKKRSENIQQVKKTTELESEKFWDFDLSFSQIPRYVYLLAFFALLSGVFYPLITLNPPVQVVNNVITGVAMLFLGLVGAILVYKGTTVNKNRAAVIGLGFALIAVSLALIFTIAGTPA